MKCSRKNNVSHVIGVLAHSIWTYIVCEAYWLPEIIFYSPNAHKCTVCHVKRHSQKINEIHRYSALVEEEEKIA